MREFEKAVCGLLLGVVFLLPQLAWADEDAGGPAWDVSLEDVEWGSAGLELGFNEAGFLGAGLGLELPTLHWKYFFWTTA